VKNTVRSLTKIEHVLKRWEKRYGYLGLSPNERDFFSPVADKHFVLDLLGNKLYCKFDMRYGRIYVSRDALRDLKVGDILVCHRNRNGNFHIEKKQ